MGSQSVHSSLSRLTGQGFLVFFVLCLAFSVLTAVYNLWLSLLEILLVLILAVFFRADAGRRREQVSAYLDSMALGADAASRKSMISSPMPIVIYQQETDEIIWSNDLFLEITGDREHMFETKLSALVPAYQSQWLMDGNHVCPDPVAVGDRQFLVFGNLVNTEGESGYLATTYWVDVTRYASVADAYQDTRPILGLIQIDNYDDLCRGLEEGDRAILRSRIHEKIVQWMAPSRCVLLRYNRENYLFYVEAGRFQEFVKKKFSLLEEVRAVTSPNGVAATLSIGVGRDGGDPRELYQFAAMALDMALSRGGDQVVVKNDQDFLFIGGRSRETERRTKVKSRVIASALSELLASTSQVILMGHKYPDLDVLGAEAGVCAIARKKGVPVRVVRAPSPYPAELQTKALAATEKYKNVFISPEEARLLAGKDTIVVVVDTSRPEQTQFPELLEAGARVVVIDHHRRAASYIQNPALSFHDPYASSASELTAELVQSILDPGDLTKEEAEAMLSGIMLDTKSFTMRTGSRTFEIAAYLRKMGADTAQVNKFFQNGLEETVSKFRIIQEAKLYRDSIAIAVTDRRVGRPIAARAADELLNIAGIGASFVLYPEEGQACLSARSNSSLNVQVISEMLGGGGNATTAGGQFPGKTAEEVLPLLKEAIDKYLDEENT